MDSCEILKVILNMCVSKNLGVILNIQTMSFRHPFVILDPFLKLYTLFCFSSKYPLRRICTQISNNLLLPPFIISLYSGSQVSSNSKEVAPSAILGLTTFSISHDLLKEQLNSSYKLQCFERLF